MLPNTCNTATLEIQCCSSCVFFTVWVCEFDISNPSWSQTHWSSAKCGEFWVFSLFRTVRFFPELLHCSFVALQIFPRVNHTAPLYVSMVFLEFLQCLCDFLSLNAWRVCVRLCVWCFLSSSWMVVLIVVKNTFRLPLLCFRKHDPDT